MTTWRIQKRSNRVLTSHWYQFQVTRCLALARPTLEVLHVFMFICFVGRCFFLKFFSFHFLTSKDWWLVMHGIFPTGLRVYFVGLQNWEGNLSISSQAESHPPSILVDSQWRQLKSIWPFLARQGGTISSVLCLLKQGFTGWALAQSVYHYDFGWKL